MRILSLGHALPDSQVDNYNWGSALSFFDYDAMVVDPALAVSSFIEGVTKQGGSFTTYTDEPVEDGTTTATTVGLADLLRRRQDETQRLLGRGGLIVCFVGVLSGDTALYWIGHHWGERIMDWRLIRLVLTPEREKVLVESFHRHGVKLVFTARFVAGFRAAVFLTAGIAGISFWRFLFVDFVAALVGVPLGFGVAYLFTDQLPAIVRGVHEVQKLLALAGMVLLAAVIGYAAYRKSRRPV